MGAPGYWPGRPQRKLFLWCLNNWHDSHYHVAMESNPALSAPLALSPALGANAICLSIKSAEPSSRQPSSPGFGVYLGDPARTPKLRQADFSFLDQAIEAGTPHRILNEKFVDCVVAHRSYSRAMAQGGIALRSMARAEN